MPTTRPDIKIIDFIVGARPNFLKVASLIHAMKLIGDYGFKYRLIHTGQHYDENMSKIFFDQLNIPKPDINFNVGSGSHAIQTGKIMLEYEKLLKDFPPSICIVFGDVNSTLACSIVAKKSGVLIAHVEAGLRSYDFSMPEEVNRVLTDCISDYFFTTTKLAKENLIRAGIKKENIYFVGNTMIDTLKSNLKNLKKPELWENHGLIIKKYFVLTLHRPSNTDNKLELSNILKLVSKSTSNYKVVYPVHPRLGDSVIELNLPNFIIVKPQPYLEFNFLVKNSIGVITDSGGITEETTYFGIPCVTLRENTERPETVIMGTNVLLDNDDISLKELTDKIINNDWKKGNVPEKWDGRAGERIINIIYRLLR